MTDNQNEPRDYDAVLGGKYPPGYGVVLGGIEGIKNRLNSEDDEVKIAALEDALKYGDAGIDLIIEALYDPSEEIHARAILLLRKGGIKGKEALLDYDPWLVLTTFQDWRINHHVSIDDPIGRAYSVSSKYALLNLFKNSNNKYIEAIKCEINYKGISCQTAFKDFVNTLINARELLTNLKALLIGDYCNIWNLKYRNSKIKVWSILPLLKAYPNLELLHIRGRMLEEDILKSELILQVRNHKNNSIIPIKPLRHENLKTLIVDADGISDSNLAKVCNLNLPSLEYFELWLSRSDLSNINIDSLAPVLSRESFPNLAYLAVRKCGNMSEVAHAIVNSPIMENLKVLELTDGNIGNGSAFLKSPAVNRLHTLDVSGNRLPKNIIEQLSELKCRVIADSQFNDRYYSVWE
ncbi:HEAT repeat domain-containing protein [Nostoc sp.]|uniref:HEAT repeat domain-containing protein n=1 Tax=Nostoc sp. TaxID=1180 RepID=UPI002FF783A5